MENVIVERVADFLKQHPPFQDVESNQLLKLAGQVRVHYVPKRNFVFKEGDTAHTEFYVVQQGAVGLRSKSISSTDWIDICDEGDILGLRPLFADQTYAMEAVAREECVLYAIPIEAFKNLLLSNQAVMNFLLESFASNTRNPQASETKGKLLSTNYAYNEQQTTTDLDFFQQAFYTKNPICLSPRETIQQAAFLMNKHKISSLIIEENKLPVGIVTDKDIRRWVATGEISIAEKVSEIMSFPVACVPPNIHLADVQSILLQLQIGHLCVTIDGSPETEIVGVLSEHDIVTAQSNNPVALLKQIDRVHKIESLVRIRESLSSLLEAYLRTELPMPYTMKVSRLISQALMHRVIEISEEKIGKAPVKFSWLGIGSQGRGEQILLTDQDHALVFEDVAEDILTSTQAYFLALAKEVSSVFAQLGYVFCPAEMMASNPSYCLSLSQWKQQFSKWINQASSENMMMCSIFFDFAKVYGEAELAEHISTHIYQKLKGNQSFFAYLAQDALKNPPPLGFFRQFVIENDGKHKDEFDLKARAIQPLVDAARVLILDKGVKTKNNTIERFETLMELEPQNEEIYAGCIKSFHVLSKFRAVEGFDHNTSGRYIDLSKLSKSDKMKLKRTFKPINEIQSLLKTRFKLTYFL
jgi:CBS domain-containing protein